MDRPTSFHLPPSIRKDSRSGVRLGNRFPAPAGTIKACSLMFGGIVVDWQLGKSLNRSNQVKYRAIKCLTVNVE